jgi:hypothetical protein
MVPLHRRLPRANDSAQAQPLEAGVACNDDARLSIIGQPHGAAAVAWSVLCAPDMGVN